MHTFKRRLVASAGTAAVLLLAGLGPAQAEESQEHGTLAIVAPEVLEGSLMADDLRGAPSGPMSTQNGDVTLPSDSSRPAVIRSDETTIRVNLPASEKKAKAVAGSDGQVQFDNGDGSITSALPKEDGSLQVATTITSSAAPTSYRYGLGVASGASLELRPDGGVDIVSNKGEYLGGVAAPWAKDSSGRDIATHYEVAGTSLVQVVAHTASNDVAYPVVADPWFGIDLYYSPYVTFTSQGYKINVSPTYWGTQNRDATIWWAHRDEVRTKLGSNSWRWTNSIQEQFYCHIAGYPASLPEYNLESWRPTINWATSLTKYRCNPYDGYWS